MVSIVILLVYVTLSGYSEQFEINSSKTGGDECNSHTTEFGRCTNCDKLQGEDIAEVSKSKCKKAESGDIKSHEKSK